MSTTAQALTCYRLCRNLTKMYCSIDLIALDERSGNVIVLSKQEINIEIDPEGEWSFV
jgi:hypothetical protein